MRIGARASARIDFVCTPHQRVTPRHGQGTTPATDGITTVRAPQSENVHSFATNGGTSPGLARPAMGAVDEAAMRQGSVHSRSCFDSRSKHTSTTRL